MKNSTAAALHNIVETIKRDGAFNILVKTIRATGFSPILSDAAAVYTFFAPNEAAFKKLSAQGTLKGLLDDKNRLTSVMRYHIVPGRLVSAHMDGRKLVRTLEGGDLIVETIGRFQVNGGQVIRPDIECSNGIIHEIDTVLLPPGPFV
jgi:uncharacterized surface protein with fasciclin (FAS1) repeats